MDSKDVVLYRLRILVRTCMFVGYILSRRKYWSRLYNETGFSNVKIPLKGNFELRKIKSVARIDRFYVEAKQNS